MNRFEKYLNGIYRPNPQPWKHRVLFWLAFAILLATMAAGYAQHEYDYANNGIWFLFAVSGTFGLSGVLVSLFGNDFWVAMLLGRP